MANEFDITCVCGFDNRVTSGMLGTTRECVNCGADLFVDPEEARPIGEEPEAPSRTELLNQEERRRAATSMNTSIGADDSPFAEEPEPNAPASPFAEEGASKEYNLFAEAAPEPERFDDIDLPPSRLGYVEVQTVSSLDKDIEGACASCGKNFRGVWDQVETPEGIVCYVCSNQATDSIPDRIREDRVQRENEEPEVLYPVEIDNEVKTPKGFILGIDTESEGFKRIVMVISVATILVALAVWMFDDSSGPPVPSISSSAAAETVPEVPQWVTGVILGWKILGAYLAAFITIYFVCEFGPGLPHDTFGMNALYFGYFLGILTLIEAVYFGVAWILSEIPYAGVIWMMLAHGIIGLVYIWAFIHYLDFRIRDFILMIVFSVVAGGLVQAVSMFFYAGLAKLVL